MICSCIFGKEFQNILGNELCLTKAVILRAVPFAIVLGQVCNSYHK